MKKLFLILLLFVTVSVSLFGSRLPLDPKNKIDFIKERLLGRHPLRSEFAKDVDKIRRLRTDSLNCKLKGGWFRGPCNAVFAVDTLTYIGDGRYFKVLNTKDPENPVVIGEIQTPSSILDITVSNNIAYIASGSYGLRIIDVSDPDNLSEIGSYDSASVDGIFVEDTFAYILVKRGFNILNISNPSLPYRVGKFSNSLSSYGIYVRDTLAYFLTSSILYIVDISKPSDPDTVSFCETGSWANGLSVVDSFAYVVDYDSGFSIIDISDPLSPAKIGSHSPADGFFNDIYAEGSLVYMAVGGTPDKSLRIIDVSNPSNSIEIGRCRAGESAMGVYIEGPNAYVAGAADGVRIVDVSNPYAPVERGFYDTGGGVYGIYVKNQLAYIADGYDGLKIFDISDPSNPLEISNWDIGSMAYSVSVIDTLAYLANVDSGLCIINVSDPSNPFKVGSYNTDGYTANLFVSDTLTYLADYIQGLRIINTKNPANPQEVGFYNVGPVYDVCVVDTFTYFVTLDSGLFILNVSDPANPFEVGPGFPGFASYGVFVSGGFAYIANVLDGLQIVNVADPLDPFNINTYKVEGMTRDVYVVDTFAYAASNTRGLRIISIANPANPYEVGYYEGGEEANCIFVEGNIAYVANGREGFYIVNHIGGAEIEDVSANPKSFVINNLSEVRINYNVVNRERIKINVYNILGQKVASLVDAIQSAGSYSIDWNGESSGIYFVKVEIGKDTKTYKTMIMR